VAADRLGGVIMPEHNGTDESGYATEIGEAICNIGGKVLAYGCVWFAKGLMFGLGLWLANYIVRYSISVL
jgi:hypothetical protein